MQRLQHKSTSDPVAAPKNNPFGAIFIEFGDTKKCCTFSGLELAPKSRKKLIGALSCMHKGPKCIQTVWDHPKKITLGKSTKKARYVRSLGKKQQYGAFPEAKKANWRSQLHAEWSKMHSNPLGPSQKIPLVQKHKESAICAIVREKFVLLHKRNFFLMVQKGLTAFWTFVRAAESAN